MIQKTLNRLQSKTVIFFSCDVQTLFHDPKLIYEVEGVIDSVKFMSELAGIMKIPVVVSEHNPKVFGKTLPQIMGLLPSHHYLYEKFSFTMLNDECQDHLKTMKERDTVVIYGLESHICINATCLDLLQRGYQVQLLTDGTSSSKSIFRSTAIQKLQQQGVVLNTTQGVMFELLDNYKSPEFKECIRMLKRYPNEFILSHL